jgi:hypothetical protein
MLVYWGHAQQLRPRLRRTLRGYILQATVWFVPDPKGSRQGRGGDPLLPLAWQGTMFSSYTISHRKGDEWPL